MPRHMPHLRATTHTIAVCCGERCVRALLVLAFVLFSMLIAILFLASFGTCRQGAGIQGNG